MTLLAGFVVHVECQRSLTDDLGAACDLGAGISLDDALIIGVMADLEDAFEATGCAYGAPLRVGQLRRVDDAQYVVRASFGPHLGPEADLAARLYPECASPLEAVRFQFEAALREAYATGRVAGTYRIVDIEVLEPPAEPEA